MVNYLRFCVLCTVLFAAFVHGNGHKILVIVPLYGKSHWDYMKVFIDSLLNRGNEITCITSMTMGDHKPHNYTEILIDPPYYRKNLGKLWNETKCQWKNNVNSKCAKLHSQWNKRISSNGHRNPHFQRIFCWQNSLKILASIHSKMNECKNSFEAKINTLILFSSKIFGPMLFWFLAINLMLRLYQFVSILFIYSAFTLINLDLS